MTANKLQLSGERIDWTNGTGSSVSVGGIVQVGNLGMGRANDTIANGSTGSVSIRGVFEFTALSTDTGTFGTPWYWDSTNSRATTTKTALPLGRGARLKSNGDTVAWILLQPFAELQTDILPISLCPELDCETGEDTAEHEVIPAAANPVGWIVKAIFARVTEVMAGSSEDQGVVTVYDEDDNALATLTASDAAADALGDVIEGYFLHEAATGDALKTVAAAKNIYAKVTQATSGGTPAGKMRVYVEVVPLI
jgi:predicted RecA/RadA family phage recombinase